MSHPVSGGPILRIWPLPASGEVDDNLLTDWHLPHEVRPAGTWVRMNFVASIDGSAGRAGASGRLSGAADKRVFEILRRVCDVVMVGAGTVRAEGYGPMRVSADSAQWRLEHGRREHPVFAIPTARADLDPASRIFTEAPVRPIVFTVGSAPVGRRRALAEVADVIVCGDEVLEPALMMSALAGRGLGQVLCEGGPQLHGSLLAAGVLDEMFLTVSPVLEGGGGLGRIVAGSPTEHGQTMTLVSVLTSEDFLLLRYRR